MKHFPGEVVHEENPYNEEVASLSLELEDGKVVVNLGDDGKWLGSCHLRPVDAVVFAEALIGYAEEAKSS